MKKNQKWTDDDGEKMASSIQELRKQISSVAGFGLIGEEHRKVTLAHLQAAESSMRLAAFAVAAETAARRFG